MFKHSCVFVSLSSSLLVLFDSLRECVPVEGDSNLLEVGFDRVVKHLKVPPVLQQYLGECGGRDLGPEALVTAVSSVQGGVDDPLAAVVSVLEEGRQTRLREEVAGVHAQVLVLAAKQGRR